MKTGAMRVILSVLLMSLGLAAQAEMAPRAGWVVLDSAKAYGQLVDDVKAAVKANKMGNKMGVVTQAGPTGAAKNRGIIIPGNRVIGVFNNRYAVRTTLSYKMPSTVFAPYTAEADADLGVAAGELDAIFLAIAEMAVQ